MHKLILIASLFFVSFIYAQQDNSVQVIGKRFYGKFVNGENIREVDSNVVIIQGDVRITCDKAIHYIDKNEVELIGNVIVKQDSIIIKTPRGYYFGNTKTAFSKFGVSLTDGHINLNSKNGYYYFDEKRSYFYENVTLKEGISNIASEKLNYYDNEDKAVAVGNVIVSDTASTVIADSLINFRKTKSTSAFNNIRIYNVSNRIALFGERLIDDAVKKYSKVWGNPLLIRMDTTSTGQLDTLMIAAKEFESFDDSTSRLIAKDSVKIIRKDFASSNTHTVFYRSKDEIEILKQENDLLPPVLWNQEAQLSGDSVYINTKDNQLRQIILKTNSSVISANKQKAFRFDQMSGRNIDIKLNDGKIEKTESTGNALSIYYMYDEDEPNGLVKSSSDKAILYFSNKEVSDVKLYGKPATEYHPENMIEGKEKDFTIPSFRMFTGRPTKELLIMSHNKILKFLMKDAQYYVAKLSSKKRKP